MDELVDVLDEKIKRDRSPAFPFIPLEKAIERVDEFAEKYQKHEVRIVNAGIPWNFRPMSSQSLQTVAALKYFGLMEDFGSREERKVKLTELAWKILYDDRPGARAKAIQEAALQSKAIADLWSLWGAHRPYEAECISELHIEKGFTREAAKRFLEIYDDTIAYAKLAESDILTAHETDKIPEHDTCVNGQKTHPLSIQPKGSEVDLMEDERVVYTYESQPENRVRLIVSGAINDELLDALEIYVTLQKRKLQTQKPREIRDIGRQLPSNTEEQQSQMFQESPHSWEHRPEER